MSTDCGGKLIGVSDRSSLTRTLLRLAIPTLGSLIAEPLFVLVDSAIVGHLGTTSLAGLSLASTVLLTVVGLLIFLAYATTATVARLTGRGDDRAAFAHGMDGIWLAIGIGIVLLVVALIGGPTILGWFHPSPDVLTDAVAYLRVSALGLPGMLAVLAATGVLRGRQDARTPLWVAGVGAAVNAALNVALVYGAGLGIAGSALGTALTQTGMGAVLTGIVITGARRHGSRLRPHPGNILAAARGGIPLFVRSLSLRVGILITTAVATSLGSTALGAHQIINSVWGFTAFALDALAIAAQTVVAGARGRLQTTKHTGSAELTGIVRAATRWSVVMGVVLGAALALASPWLPMLFTADPAVQSAATVGLLACAIAMPIAGYVFLLDGVLIGAEQGRYLAVAGIITLAAYCGVLGIIFGLEPIGTLSPIAGIALLWGAFTIGFTGARAVADRIGVRRVRW